MRRRRLKGEQVVREFLKLGIGERQIVQQEKERDEDDVGEDARIKARGRGGARRARERDHNEPTRDAMRGY